LRVEAIERAAALLLSSVLWPIIPFCHLRKTRELREGMRREQLPKAPARVEKLGNGRGVE
jgi:hypothetical protein